MEYQKTIIYNMENKLSVKVSFGGDIRRFTVEKTWDKITSTIKKLFPNLDLNNHQITYQDDEGDWIVIDSQEELHEAASQLDKKKPILRISLKQKRTQFMEKKQCENGYKHNPNLHCNRLNQRRNHFHFIKLHHESLRLMESRNREALLAAKELLYQQLKLKPNHPIPIYNLACTESLLGNIDIAIKYLEKSVALGFRDVNHIEDDQDLESLHQDERFQDIVNKLKQEKSLGEENCLRIFKIMLHRKVMQLFDIGTKEALESAKQLLLKLVSLEESDSIPTYNLSCVEALLGNTKAALECLEHAISLGYNDLNHILQDNDLESIRQLPEFQKIVSVLQPEDRKPKAEKKIGENPIEQKPNNDVLYPQPNLLNNENTEDLLIEENSVEEKLIELNSAEEKPIELNSVEEKTHNAFMQNLKILYEMGFSKEENLRALNQANGNLEAAVSFLLY